MPKAWSFARVSSSQQKQRGGGLQRQGVGSGEEARAWCEANGHEYVEGFSFVGSAYKGVHLQEGAPLQAWLEQAVAGELGERPALIVEDIDRFTRQAGHVALVPLLTRVFPAGVRIVTLKDGTVYSQEAFERDDRLLGDLLDEIRAAHRYSKRLSRRLAASWEQTRSRAAEGAPIRPGAIKPFWLDFEDGKWVLNDLAPLIQRIFNLAEEVGGATIARELNADKVPALTRRGDPGRPWTASGVMSHLRNRAACGVLVLRRYGKEVMEKPGYFPEVISKEQFDYVTRRIKARQQDPHSRGRTAATRWIGLGITHCQCGAAVRTTASGTRPNGQKARPGFRYLVCGRRRNELNACNAPVYRLDQATAHLLTRLLPAQLEALIDQGGGRVRLVKAAISERDEAQRAVEVARMEMANSGAALKGAIKAGSATAMFVEAFSEAEATDAAARDRLRAANARLGELQSMRLSAELGTPVRELMQAFAAGSDTEGQRKAVNRGLRKLGVQILLSDTERALGLSIGGGAPNWQPVDPAQMEFLAEGRAGIQSEKWMGDLAVIDDDQVRVYSDAEWLAGFPSQASDL